MNDFGNIGGAASASWMLVGLLANVENPELQGRALAIMKLQQAVDERLMALMADAKAIWDAEKAAKAKPVELVVGTTVSVRMNIARDGSGVSRYASTDARRFSHPLVRCRITQVGFGQLRDVFLIETADGQNISLPFHAEDFELVGVI